MKRATQLSVGRFGTKSWRARAPFLDDETRCEGPARIKERLGQPAVAVDVLGVMCKYRWNRV